MPFSARKKNLGETITAVDTARRSVQNKPLGHTTQVLGDDWPI
jgi:hypothetical protein